MYPIKGIERNRNWKAIQIAFIMYPIKGIERMKYYTV